MATATFEHLIFIRASLDQVWSGLLEPRYTRVYWFHDNVSDWKVGSPWTHRSTNAEGTVDIQGTVLESDRPRRLVLTWAEPSRPAEASRVSFDLEPAPEDWPGSPWTSLRVVHSDLVPGSEMHTGISWGWPAVTSGLKTLLETGKLER